MEGIDCPTCKAPVSNSTRKNTSLAMAALEWSMIYPKLPDLLKNTSTEKQSISTQTDEPAPSTLDQHLPNHVQEPEPINTTPRVNESIPPNQVDCPICLKRVKAKQINIHLDSNCKSHIIIVAPPPTLEPSNTSTTRSKRKARNVAPVVIDSSSDVEYVSSEKKKKSGGANAEYVPSSPPPHESQSRKASRSRDVESTTHPSSIPDTRTPKASLAYSMLKDKKIREILQASLESLFLICTCRMRVFGHMVIVKHSLSDTSTGFYCTIQTLIVWNVKVMQC